MAKMTVDEMLTRVNDVFTDGDEFTQALGALVIQLGVAKASAKVGALQQETVEAQRVYQAAKDAADKAMGG